MFHRTLSHTFCKNSSSFDGQNYLLAIANNGHANNELMIIRSSWVESDYQVIMGRKLQLYFEIGQHKR